MVWRKIPKHFGMNMMNWRDWRIFSSVICHSFRSGFRVDPCFEQFRVPSLIGTSLDYKHWTCLTIKLSIPHAIIYPPKKKHLRICLLLFGRKNHGNLHGPQPQPPLQMPTLKRIPKNKVPPRPPRPLPRPKGPRRRCAHRRSNPSSEHPTGSPRHWEPLGVEIGKTWCR